MNNIISFVITGKVHTLSNKPPASQSAGLSPPLEPPQQCLQSGGFTEDHEPPKAVSTSRAVHHNNWCAPSLSLPRISLFSLISLPYITLFPLSQCLFRGYLIVFLPIWLFIARLKLLWIVISRGWRRKQT